MNASHQVDRWRPLVTGILAREWPSLDPAWALGQIAQESAGDPAAVSESGAEGLLQLMPPTAMEMGVTDIGDPRQNLTGGIRYLRDQWHHFPEITKDGPNWADRMRWSWAAYNCGRGFCNKALDLARAAHPTSPAFWWQWSYARYFLSVPECKVGGLTPYWRQVYAYVALVESFSIQAFGAGRFPEL